MPLSHRLATLEDMPDVFKMYCQAMTELGDEHNEIDALEYCLACFRNAPCVLLIENGTIIGFAGLDGIRPSYNKSKIFLREYMFFILPPFRGVRAWRELSRGVQGVSDKLKIPFVGEHRLTGSIKFHERLIRMAGARPFAIVSVYGDY